MKYCVYMMVADAGNGFSFCKIGITTDLANRVNSVQIGCPVPITDVAYMDMSTGNARKAEAMFHAQLREFHSQGEWFRIDLANPEHKEKFGAATRLVQKWYSLPGVKWKHMDLDAVRMMCRVLRLDKAA